MEVFETFRRAVLNDPAMHNRLRAVERGSEFAEACVREARALTIELTTSDIDNALKQARREWIERWIA